MANLAVTKNEPWAQRHNVALAVGVYNRPTSFASAMVSMLMGWEAYAKQHKQRYESPIGEDGVLGQEWQAIGEGLIGLLNGELGELDGGTLDAFLRDTMRENGIELEP